MHAAACMPIFMWWFHLFSQHPISESINFYQASRHRINSHAGGSSKRNLPNLSRTRFQHRIWGSAPCSAWVVWEQFITFVCSGDTHGHVGFVPSRIDEETRDFYDTSRVLRPKVLHHGSAFRSDEQEKSTSVALCKLIMTLECVYSRILVPHTCVPIHSADMRIRHKISIS